MREHVPTPPHILQVRDLIVRYGEEVAVNGVDLDLPQGRLLALLGASGCGKTSLLRAIAGFESPTAGTIDIDGRRVFDNGTNLRAEKRNVGMVFQEGALFPHMTVWQNVCYGVKGQDDAEDRGGEALELVGLTDYRHRYPDELSGGQQQRVALARALAPSPSIVLLDEPFANLDATLRQRVREQVRDILEAAGTTSILVTHDQEEALSVAELVAVMVSGRIRQVGTPEEIYHQPASLDVATFVGEGQLVACDVRDGIAHCRFGSVPTVEGAPTVEATDGPGHLFVRPEDLRVLPADHPEGAHGKVVRRRFFGHDLLDDVELEVSSGTGEAARIQVRQLSSSSCATGVPVRICLREKPFRIFPSAS